MGLQFLIKAVERCVVASPEDAAISPEHAAELRAFEFGRSIPPGAARFEMRGLTQTELRQLSSLHPSVPAGVPAYFEAVASGAEGDPAVRRLAHGYLAALRDTYLRAALCGVEGVDGWPTERTEHLGLWLWPTTTLDGLPRETREWLGEVAFRLSTLDAQKKRPSSSPVADPTGTTAASTSEPTAAESG